MTGRTSVRSSAKRDQASSPPKSSAGRATRSTRSQSRELGGDSDTGDTRKRGTRRTTRAGSEDSIRSEASNASNASSRGGRTRKATRAAVANRDLSMVAEDRDQEEEDAGADEQLAAVTAPRSQSPGVLSQMSGVSGTTAVTSFSAAAIADLDPMMAEIMPDLLDSSVRILDLLVPAGATNEMVDSVVRELKTPGSRRAKRLRFEEDKFKLSREHYGTEDLDYIMPTFVLRRLLGDAPGEGFFRPDAIIHAANLAILVKTFAVTNNEGPAMNKPLSNLSIHFPEPFVSKFDNEIKYGSSMLLDEAFALGLDIRTQWVVYNLHRWNGSDDYSPEEILMRDFFEAPAEPNDQVPLYDDYRQNGRPKNIFRAGPENSSEQNAKIVDRVTQIYATFNQSEDAIEQDDLVDFEKLDEQFGWSRFLADLILWSRSRLNEVSRSIKQEGGILNITEALIETMKNNDSQVDVTYRAPPTVMRQRELLPPATITPSAPGQSLYGGKDSIRRLKQYKRDSSSSEAPSSNQKASGAPSSSRPNEPPLFKRATVNSNASKEITQQVDDDYRPHYDEEHFEPPQGSRSTQEYFGAWTKWNNEKNKENRPIDQDANASVKRRLLDRQPTAQRISWDSQEDDDLPSNRKRSREASEESEDQGFEEDQRVPDAARRLVAPAPPHEPSPKRYRRSSPPAADDAGNEDARRVSQQRAEARLQAEARHRYARSDEVEDDEDDDDDAPAPTFSALAATARQKVQKIRMKSSQTQQRIKWSEEDSERLIDLIEDHGCSWAFIQKMGGFEVERDQVALKDKARNLKVLFLKSNTVLPNNFDKIALGRKELISVRAVRPDYDPEAEN